MCDFGVKAEKNAWLKSQACLLILTRHNLLDDLHCLGAALTIVLKFHVVQK